MQNKFQPVVEVRTTGAQVIGIKVCVPKKIKENDLTFKTFPWKFAVKILKGNGKKYLFVVLKFFLIKRYI